MFLSSNSHQTFIWRYLDQILAILAFYLHPLTKIFMRPKVLLAIQLLYLQQIALLFLYRIPQLDMWIT